VKKKATVFTTP